MEADINFVIPLEKDDLLKAPDDQYRPQQLELKTALKELSVCKRAVADKGCAFILEYFDILFSVLLKPEDVNFDDLQEMWDVIHLVLQDLRRFVQEGLGQDGSSEKKFYLTVLCMNVYIFSLYIKVYEEKLTLSSENLIMNKKVKGKSKQNKYETPWEWNSVKKTAFSLINEVLQENINLFWDPPIVDDQFVNLIASCCYKALENPEIVQAKSKPLKDALSQVLAVLVTQYNHAFSFIPRCVQLLKSHEHAATALAGSLVTMVVDYKCSSILPKVLREMVEEAKDEDIQDLGKSVAVFITTISENNPEIFLPCIKIISKSLAFEPYALRNAVLIVFCDILLKCYGPESENEDKKTRDMLLKFLHNHLRDQSSYVRSKALQLWTKLVTAQAVPVDFFMTVLRTARARLTDSSSHVVKSSIQFFTAILKYNIYAGKFNVTDLKNEVTKAKDILKEIQNKQLPSKDLLWNLIEPDLAIKLNLIIEQGGFSSKDCDSHSNGGNEPIEDIMKIIALLLQKKHFSEAYELIKTAELLYPEAQEIRCNKSSDDEVEYYIAVFKKIFLYSMSNYNPYEEEFEQQKRVVEYLEDTIAFALIISDASKDIESPLFGQSTIEGIEAIEFFTTAFQFSAGDAKRVVKRMITLIWSKVPGIKEAVTRAYRTLYLESSQPTPRGKAMQAASRLIKLLKDLDNEQKSALEELIHMWFKDNDLNRDFIQVLWEIFSKKLPQFSPEDSIGALMILDIIAEKNPLLVSLNLQVLIDNGLQKENNLLLIEYTCRMISKLSDTEGDDNKSTRLTPENDLFHKVSDILVEMFKKNPLNGFMSLANAALRMIYKVCWNPVKVSDDILEVLFKITIEEKETKSGEDCETPSCTELTALLSFFGDSVLRKWQYFDKDVFNYLKKEVNAPNLNDSASLEEEFEVESQVAANDDLMNSIRSICEDMLNVENSIELCLSKLTVALSFGKTLPPTLTTVAVATLTKLMVVSSSFCENNMQILVTLMERSLIDLVRANAVLSFGDLIVRFPNILEPWTHHLYARLKDTSSLVRTNTVVVLCHLITREMIKVRGHIAELCLCLEDPEPEIADRVIVLFKSLSQKGNTLYNVIPDIISRLSDPQRKDTVPMPIFKRIMTYVLGLIGKERQNDLLVEKLCVRLLEADTELQWSQLSFCLSQLNYSEKSLKKLIECMPTLNERIMCQDVYNAISDILTTASKSHFTKPQYKELASEGLTKLQELVTLKDDAIGAADGVANLKLTEEEEKDEDNDDGVFVEPATPRVPRSTRRAPRSTTRSSKKTPLVPLTETPRTTRAKRKLK